MKITKTQLKRIIKEEVEGLLQEEHTWASTRVVPGELYGDSPSPVDPEQEEAATRKCFDVAYKSATSTEERLAAFEKCMDEEMGMEAQDVPGTEVAPDFYTEN